MKEGVGKESFCIDCITETSKLHNTAKQVSQNLQMWKSDSQTEID